MERPSFQPRRLSFTWVTVVASTVLPGNTQERTGNPSRVRARPTTTGGWFPRPFCCSPACAAAEGRVALGLALGVFVIDLKVHTGRIPEDEVHISLGEIGSAKKSSRSMASMWVSRKSSAKYRWSNVRAAASGR